MRSFVHRAATSLLPLCTVQNASVLAQSCTPGWSDAFPSGALTGTVYAMADFDPDGAGPAPTNLIAAGDFTLAGGLPVGRIARWDGRHWLPLGAGVSGGSTSTIYAAAVFDEDGAGPLPPALFVCGTFGTAGSVTAGCIARWNGAAWSSPGQIMISGGATARCMTVYDDDGPGPHPPALYIGGTFTSAGGVSVHHLAKWDGVSWADVGGGITASSPTINAMTVFDDDGPGPHLPVLVIGGNFDHAGAVAADCLAAWNGTSWRSLNLVNGPVVALAVHDEDGDGPGLPKLFAGGSSAGGASVRRLDGTTWTTISSNGVTSLAVFDEDGAGPDLPALFAGGGFTSFGGVSGLNGIARWNGTSWDAAGPGIGIQGLSPITYAMFPTDAAGAQTRLCVAGSFQAAGGLAAGSIATWDGLAWQNFGNAIGGQVNALAAYDPDGAGPSSASLVIGGAFISAGQTPAGGVVRWNGSSFTPLGAGVTGGVGGVSATAVNAIVVFDEDGAGPNPPALFVGGEFTAAGGVAANRIARWDGSAWWAVGAGFDSIVQALAVFDDGSGPHLYAGGRFRFSGLTSTNYLAKWTGSTWVDVPSQLNARVRSLAVFDDDGPGPTPPALYVGHESNNFPPYLGRWNGSSWSAVASGPAGPVYALSALDPDGPGGAPPVLYVGGNFTTAGGVVAKHVGTWDGTSWGSVGFGFQNGVNAEVYAVSGMDDDGGGPNPWSFFAGGQFTVAGTTPVRASAKFDGGDWFSLNGGLVDPQQAMVNALLPFDDDGPGPATPAMYVGGRFLSAGGVSSGNLARWGCPAPAPCYANCDASTTAPVLNVLDFACFLNRYASGDPYANCDGSTTPPVLNVLDFSCFLNRYAAGCP